MITFTDRAIERINKAVTGDGAPDGQCFRIAIAGVGKGGYRYDFALDEEKYVVESDVVVEQGGFKTIIDKQSAERLKGATVDWAEDEMGKATFKVDNPNNPKLDTQDPVVQKVQDLIDSEINPAIADHGGFIELIDFKEDRLFIKMGGGCQGCGMSDVTLKQGIETLIKDNVPQVTEVIDTTDHAGGTNPYYSPR